MDQVPMKRCTRCEETKLTTQFYRHQRTRDGLAPHCKRCHMVIARSDPRMNLWRSSHANAKRKNIKHTIKKQDIPLPEFCVYFKIKLDYSNPTTRDRYRPDNAPSIDRIDPSKGYEPGNIQVISELANRMKSNATVEQMLQFARGVIEVHG